ncbi:hypothetical protein EDD11_006203, partial [Mortierella claussenii]
MLVGLDADFVAIADAPAKYSGLPFIGEDDSNPTLCTRLENLSSGTETDLSSMLTSSDGTEKQSSGAI